MGIALRGQNTGDETLGDLLILAAGEGVFDLQFAVTEGAGVLYRNAGDSVGCGQIQYKLGIRPFQDGAGGFLAVLLGFSADDGQVMAVRAGAEVFAALLGEVPLVVFRPAQIIQNELAVVEQEKTADTAVPSVRHWYRQSKQPPGYPPGG